jgi:hypothetical protein
MEVIAQESNGRCKFIPLPALTEVRSCFYFIATALQPIRSESDLVSILLQLHYNRSDQNRTDDQSHFMESSPNLWCAPLRPIIVFFSRTSEKSVFSKPLGNGFQLGFRVYFVYWHYVVNIISSFISGCHT